MVFFFFFKGLLLLYVGARWNARISQLSTLGLWLGILIYYILGGALSTLNLSIVHIYVASFHGLTSTLGISKNTRAFFLDIHTMRPSNTPEHPSVASPFVHFPPCISCALHDQLLNQRIIV